MAVLHAGGYGISFESTLKPRITMSELLLIFLLFFIVDRAAAGIFKKPKWQFSLAAVPLLILATSFAPAAYREQTKWAAAWTSTLATIDTAPDFHDLQEGTAVIYNGPN